MGFYWLLVATLCVFRVTHFLTEEDGPWGIVVRLRRRLGHGFWGGLFDCFYCMSIWVAAGFAWALEPTWSSRLLHWPALSAGAIVIERITRRRASEDLPLFHEVPEAAAMIDEKAEESS